MLRSTAAFLHGKAFPRLGQPPPLPMIQPRWLVSRLLRGKSVYSADDEIDSERQAEQDAEAVADWMVHCYPKRRYPAIALGSANGAVVHLCAALGIPWLPQVFSVPLRQPPRLQEAEKRPAVRTVNFCRVTRRGLGSAYRTFLSSSVAVGGCVLMVSRIPAGQGGSSDGGMEPGMREELLEVARRRRLAVVQLAYHEPEDLSPLVADLYSWWYRRRSIIARRLLASSVIVTDPLWTLRVGAVPFWLEYIAEPSAAALERYLEMRPPFDYINLCLFHHGAASDSLPPVERWQGILARAKRRGEFVGVDAASYPADFSSFSRYQNAIKRIPARFPVPPPLPLEEFGGFLRYARRYRVAVEPVDGVVRWLG